MPERPASPHTSDDPVAVNPTSDGATIPARIQPRPGIPGDDYVNGGWKLEVATIGAGSTGTLHRWSVFITSRSGPVFKLMSTYNRRIAAQGIAVDRIIEQEKQILGWMRRKLPARFTLEAELEFHPENRRHWYEVETYASELENVRFFGFGNDTPEDVPRELRDTWLRQVRVEPSLHIPFGERTVLELGPVLQWTDAEVELGSPLDVERPTGFDKFGQLGVRAELELDGRDVPSFPRRGWRLETGGSGYPAVWDAGGAFGEAHAMAATYLSFGAGPILALRAGGKRVWGDFPFYESAFLGGGSTLRGYTGQRFAGDMMAFGGAELRMPLFRMNFIARGIFGVMGLMDAGRVWYDGESDGELHTGVGGGVFYHFAGQTVTVTAATGERTSVNFGFGMPF